MNILLCFFQTLKFHFLFTKGNDFINTPQRNFESFYDFILGKKIWADDRVVVEFNVHTVNKALFSSLGEFYVLLLCGMCKQVITSYSLCARYELISNCIDVCTLGM